MNVPYRIMDVRMKSVTISGHIIIAVHNEVKSGSGHVNSSQVK